LKRRTYVPDVIDHDYIESLGAPLDPALLAIEAAGVGAGVPIVDRASGRVLRVLAAGRRRIVEVGTAYGFSTLWMALGQPADGTIVTIDPDTTRTDLARGWWRQAGVPDARITIVSRPALAAFAEGDPALAGPFDMAFIDALKDEYAAYLVALRPRLAPGALVMADNVLWGGTAARPDGPDGPGRGTQELRDFSAALLADPAFTATILPVGDGLLMAVLR